MITSHFLVLGDQLNYQHGPLATVEPAKSSVLMIESLELADSLPHHKQKLIHCFSAMRHFAAELKEAGFRVHYQQVAESFEAGLKAYLEQFAGVTLTMMQPNDAGYDSLLKKVAQKYGGDINFVKNELWLSDREMFSGWVAGRKTLRMEYFYRDMRKLTGYLMQGDGQPQGGIWNFDKDNRKPARSGQAFRRPLGFELAGISRDVIQLVNERFPDHFGDAEPFAWPVTREHALKALHDFCEHRLRDFGVYEDAMLQGEYSLNHSLLSPLINTGLLHPGEVIETALSYYEDKRYNIPLNSIEGFVRQILGWREFMFQVYHYQRLEFEQTNTLGHDAKLPDLYWTGKTQMNCLKQCLTQLKETAHNHHIQRLMVLGNFALLVGVKPQELLEWFTATYIDALEWVMVPNVIGMSQYADGGGFTSKPYVASANYINKMSDYCQTCCYRPKERTGARACPFNSLYWDFLVRHKQRFATNPRMTMMLKSLESLQDREAVLAQAQKVRDRLYRGEL